jgi:hypothetical protein
MAVYQQGLLVLHRVRRNGQQRIMVPYVNVSHGSQAVIGNIERRNGQNVENYPSSVPMAKGHHRLEREDFL